MYVLDGVSLFLSGCFIAQEHITLRCGNPHFGIGAKDVEITSRRGIFTKLLMPVGLVGLASGVYVEILSPLSIRVSTS